MGLKEVAPLIEQKGERMLMRWDLVAILEIESAMIVLRFIILLWMIIILVVCLGSSSRIVARELLMEFSVKEKKERRRMEFGGKT